MDFTNDTLNRLVVKLFFEKNMNEFESHELTLANEIADTLNDRESLPLYLSFVRKYKDEHLRKILKRVMSIPDEQIKKTRGALFTFIVNNQYGNDERTRS